MRVGVFTPLLSQHGLLDVLKKLRGHGIGTVELGTGNYVGNAHCNLSMLDDKTVLADFKTTVDGEGFTISALSCHGNPLHPDVGVAKAHRDTNEKTILLAEKLGVPVVVDFSGCPGDSVDSETMLRLRSIAGPAVGCNYDPSHMFWQGIDPIAAIRVLGDAIFHVHAKDTEMYERNLPATGVLDTKPYERNRSWIFRTCGYGHGERWWREFASTLRMFGYDYVLSIEHEDSLLSAEEGLTRATSFLKQIVPRGKALSCVVGLTIFSHTSQHMKNHKVAIIGAGFMGRTHLEALRRIGGVEVALMVAEPVTDAERLAAAVGVPRTSANYRDALDDPAIDAIHICTPNFLHFPIAKAALEAGKHVVCEKPLATSAAEGELLVQLAAKRGLRNCTNHNLRYYPMVEHMRRIREDGDLGEILVAQGTHSQDWLLYDTDWNWRIESKVNGPSRVMADIGSHWCDMLEHITGFRLSAVCADLQTFHPKRKRPKVAVESFAGKFLTPDDYDAVDIDTEDFGAVVFRIGTRGRGAFTASQVSAGRKNRLSMEIYGTKASVSWDQERPDGLWVGNRNSNNQTIVKDPSLLKPAAQAYADYPGGHSEGYDDTFKQVFRRFYRSIDEPAAAPEYPQFADGLRQLQILEAELESNRRHGWFEVPS